MSYYTVEVNEINVIGTIWMPAIRCARTYKLGLREVETIKQCCNGELNREGIADWMSCHSGDFQSIEDFQADIGDYMSDWENEENEFIFVDLMYPELVD